MIKDMLFSNKPEGWWVFSCILMVLPLLFYAPSIHSSFSQNNGNLTADSAASKPDIIILNTSSISLESSATGLTSITGTIQNNSTENVENMKVKVTLYGSDNKTIRDTSRFISGPFTVYEPNSTERFSFLMSVEAFDHYGATAYAERVP